MRIYVCKEGFRGLWGLGNSRYCLGGWGDRVIGGRRLYVNAAFGVIHDCSIIV